MNTLPAPAWPYCGHGADPTTDPVGCPGIDVPGNTACLAHLNDADRTSYLTSLAPGADIDHRGTPITEHLLQALLRALHDPSTGKPSLGTARFQGATFTGDARFVGATFISTTGLGRATFASDAQFFGVTFTGTAWFGGTTFSGTAWFGGTKFSGDAQFGEATFTNDVRFDGATFSGDAQFGGATFTVLSSFGPILCAGRVDLSGCAFGAPVTMEIAAGEVDCVRTRWESTATFRLRYATVNLSHAVLSSPAAVTAHPIPFTAIGTPMMDESLLAGHAPGVRVVSVQGVDAAHLVLTDTDLSDCLFSGAFHLDQIRLEGRMLFAPTPTGIHRRHRIWPCHWTRRRTLAEEHHWRAQTAGQPTPSPGQPSSPRNWRPGPHHPNPGLTPDPDDVAAIYRQLRKAFEDGKNEPGAADFYYGEMEMRRHDHTGTPPGERGLLWGYWLLSGYGQRSSRAMIWLLTAMATTLLALMLWGLPNRDPEPATTGTLSHGKVTLNTTSPDPHLSGTWHQRLTADRAEKATRVVVNSVVFRSSGQNLTTAGTYIEMASRLLEPTLLALAVLAVRSRIKR
ncbi:pentapeptide repeat-containing protein [Streptomyces sp. ME02-8801-2C]|uniref:pentapeptide repeat-containing protein n=1 Tax=Streptomyces sp. ME02-8801-2C TaxID=3028680 RepID=UPI0029A8AD71|nr:pentapeptide repeat-containing protein [Streptomyces sp. ME02-8801-2C]MDX3458803.1 pentapeptide repeat-containing protein [Streptomyces sp. ME02-8801-2C]